MTSSESTNPVRGMIGNSSGPMSMQEQGMMAAGSSRSGSIFFGFLFVKNLPVKNWFAWRANQRPHQWQSMEILFSSIPPSNSLVSVSDPQRAFWADTAPFSGPRLASCVASGTTEIQGHSQVCRARRGGPRTPSTTTDANLDCAFVANALFYADPWFWKVNRIELS